MIKQYYNSLDKNIINNEANNNLIKLSTISNINIFNKRKKIKSKIKLLKECNNIKNKELKTYSTMLKNLIKMNSKTSDIKIICDTLQNKINNLDIFINYINYNEITNNNLNKFIEYYSN